MRCWNYTNWVYIRRSTKEGSKGDQNTNVPGPGGWSGDGKRHWGMPMAKTGVTRALEEKHQALPHVRQPRSSWINGLYNLTDFSA